MRTQDSSFYIRWISLFLLIAAVVVLIIQLVSYSRLRANYPPGMTIAGVAVGGTDPQTASQRLIQVYTSTPVELQYNGQAIHMPPSVAGFDINIDSMLAAADLQRTGRAFWAGFWDYLWNRTTSSVDIPLSATLDEERLKEYLKTEIASRYDQPAIPAQPIPGGTEFQPGTPGQELDVNRAVVLIEDALRSPTNRAVTLTYGNTAPPRPTLQNLQIQVKQIIDTAGFDGIVGFYLRDLSTGESIHFVYDNGEFKPVDPDVAFTAASTIKIPIMLSTYAKYGPTLDEPTKTLISAMITKSENPESDKLMEKLDGSQGPLFVTKVLETLGFENTFIAGYFYDNAPLLKVINTAANQRSDVFTNPDIYNQTTPSDIGTLLEDLYECSKTGGGALVAAYAGKINKEACNEMINFLVQDKIGVLIEGGVPDGTKVAHKHGWISGPSGVIQNITDAGIVYTPGGDYVLVVYVYHPIQAIWEPVSEMIAQIAETTYNYFNLPR